MRHLGLERDVLTLFLNSLSLSAPEFMIQKLRVNGIFAVKIYKLQFIVGVETGKAQSHVRQLNKVRKQCCQDFPVHFIILTLNCFESNAAHPHISAVSFAA